MNRYTSSRVVCVLCWNVLLLWGGPQGKSNTSGPPTPHSLHLFQSVLLHACEGSERSTDHTNPKTTTNKTEADLLKCNRCRPDHVFVVGHACTSTHIMPCTKDFVLRVGANDRQERRSCLISTFSRFCQSLSNHSVIIKSSSSSTRVLGARRPTKNRETRHLGARRPTQAQSTLRPQALGARRPTKRTEVLQLGSTSATQAQR